MSIRIAHLCSAHGFGHLTRQLALGEVLKPMGVKSVYFTPHVKVVLESQPGAEYLDIKLDVGIVQPDSLSIDVDETRRRLTEICSEKTIDSIATRLKDFDAAIVDIPFTGLEACYRVGLPTIAVSNFDWAWVYCRTPGLKYWGERIKGWQAKHDAISLAPGPGLTGFSTVTQAPFLARKATPHLLSGKNVLISFGGFGLERLADILPIIPEVTYIMAPPGLPLPRKDIRYIEGVKYSDLIAGVDIILSKAGYSIIAEARRSGIPLVLLERNTFPEAAHLETFARNRGDMILSPNKEPHILRKDISDAILRLLSQPRPTPMGNAGTKEVGKLVLSYLRKKRG